MKTLVARQKGVRAYPLDIKNAFDLHLYRFNTTANYQLIVAMKIQFFFGTMTPMCGQMKRPISLSSNGTRK